MALSAGATPHAILESGDLPGLSESSLASVQVLIAWGLAMQQGKLEQGKRTFAIEVEIVVLKDHLKRGMEAIHLSGRPTKP